uniref:Armadillo repeat-containing domain-containing protein n=1 Tax=Globisporangium ultimum (strain ATCC 200006 / CBS 805.95 / DAOM BR144) TaxID=431595 RepID=K3WVB0_GLOUD
MTLIEPKDAAYPYVPTPKELELSRQLVDVQQEKDQREQKLLNQITDLETQVHTLHVRIHELSEILQATKREQMHVQQLAIKQERELCQAKVRVLQEELQQEKHDKDAQQQWQRKFVVADTMSPSGQEPVDPADDVFARFAQSIALLPATSTVKVTHAGVLPFLTHLLGARIGGDLVTGSVLLALVHLAIHEKPTRPLLHRRRLACVSDSGSSSSPPASVNVKEEIIKAGAATPLVHILETDMRNPRVIVEASRLCAALAIHIPNKRVLAAKSVVRALTRLLLPVAPSVSGGRKSEQGNNNDDEPIESARMEKLPLVGDPEVQMAALSALVNLSYDSEILRSQIVNFHFLPIAVKYLRESPDLRVQAEAAKLIGNVAFNHVVNQSAAMTLEGDVALTQCLSAAENLHQSPQLIRACAIGIANLAYTSVNQLSIGYGDAMTFLLQLAVDATVPMVLEAALSAITCLCHQNPLNKSRVTAQNGLQVLLYVISQSKRYGHDEATLVAACECFAVVAKTKANRIQVLELDGHLPVCQLCKKATSALLLEASASAVCALIPSTSERDASIADSRELKLEMNRIALSALERAKHLLGQHYQQNAPSNQGIPMWLSTGIQTLTSYATAEQKQRLVGDDETLLSDAMEFHERSYFSLESATDVAPDALCPDFYKVD